MQKPKSKDYIIGLQERKSFLDAIETDEEELAVKGLLFTGMRVSEFLHMRRDWIDWNQKLIHIPYRIPCTCSESCIEPNFKSYKTDRKTREKILLKTPKMTKPSNTWQGKTKQAERPIPILPEISNLLKIYFTDYESIMDLLDNRIKIWKLVKRVGERAGIRVFPHCIRATFATILVEKGLEDAMAMTQIMGWSDIKMAMTYIRLGGVTLRNKINHIWGNENELGKS